MYNLETGIVTQANPILRDIQSTGVVNITLPAGGLPMGTVMKFVTATQTWDKIAIGDEHQTANIQTFIRMGVLKRPLKNGMSTGVVVERGGILLEGEVAVNGLEMDGYSTQHIVANLMRSNIHSTYGGNHRTEEV